MNLRKIVKRILPPSILGQIRMLKLKYDRANPMRFHSEWQSALTSDTQPEVYKKLVQGVGYCIGTGVEGHIAEFGTMSGHTACILAQSLSYFSKAFDCSDKAHHIDIRKLHLFDSFKGLPPVKKESVDGYSPHVLSGVWGEGTCQGITTEQLITLCSEYLERERILVFDGWFSDTLPLIELNTKFALVHIDCDLYESAFQVLDHFFKKNLFADGCILFFDDWNCNRASPQFGERRAWNECLNKYMPKYSNCGDYGLCGHKIIIHTD